MLELPEFPRLIYKFLTKQLHPDTPGIPLIQNDRKMWVFYSATATFCAPSNPSGVQSMRQEQIHTAPSWRNGAPRYDWFHCQQRRGWSSTWIQHLSSIPFFYFCPQEYPIFMHSHPVVLSHQRWTWWGYWNVDGQAWHLQWWFTSSCSCSYWYHLSSCTPHACIPYCAIHWSFTGHARFPWFFSASFILINLQTTIPLKLHLKQ